MRYKADLHIHTVLSPCGDLDMSPINIVEKANELGLNIIAITDHNSCKNAKVIANIAAKNGILVLCGAEVTTSEEVHCVCLMPDDASLLEFQDFIDSKVIFFPNSVEKFGYQLVIDENEDVIEEIPHLLINAIDCDIKSLQVKVDELGGIFIPAHVDRSSFSLSSQLGFVPPDLQFDVMELSYHAERNHFLENFSWFQNYKYIRSSDAHFVNDIAKIFTEFELEMLDFQHVKKALKGDEKNYVVENK